MAEGPKTRFGKNLSLEARSGSEKLRTLLKPSVRIGEISAFSVSEVAFMEWTGFTNGEFAKCKHGYYFIYGKFCREMGMERWFADYERRTEHFAGQFERFTLHGLESREEARRHCEQHANTIGLNNGL